MHLLETFTGAISIFWYRIILDHFFFKFNLFNKIYNILSRVFYNNLIPRVLFLFSRRKFSHLLSTFRSQKVTNIQSLLFQVNFVLFLDDGVWYFENSLRKQIFNFKYAAFRVWPKYSQRSPDIFKGIYVRRTLFHTCFSKCQTSFKLRDADSLRYSVIYRENYRTNKRNIN